MSLKNLITVVSGASGNVASGIAVEFLKQGAVVWAPLRNEQRFEDLKAVAPKELHNNLLFFKSDLANENDFQELKAEILKKSGKVNHVVSCFGGWQEHGPLSDVSLKDFKAALEYYITPHFLLYKTFAKVLSETPNSTFTSIQGRIADMDLLPFAPKASLIPVAARAQTGLMVSAKTEFKDNPNIKFIEYRFGVHVNKESDAKYKAENKSTEVGHDYIGKFLPKMILKHKTELYRFNNREEGDKLFAELS